MQLKRCFNRLKNVKLLKIIRRMLFLIGLVKVTLLMQSKV